MIYKIIAIYILLMNIVTFVFFYIDKKRSIRGAWRVSEMTLHLFELFGGTFASFLAQRVLRHKIRKLSYQITFYIIVLVQCVGLYFLYSAQNFVG